MNKDAFIKALVDLHGLSDFMDIDGGDMQDLYVKHGLAIERPATKQDAEAERGLEWGVCVGDPWIVWSPDLLWLLERKR